MVNQRLPRSAALQYFIVLCMGACICVLGLISNHLFEKVAGRALF
ncbi:MAG TPA: hypothetical protein VLG66_12405 [Alphaproteobacteria bacterium]|jgi:hypothetical protein|nr:hypothetical protein [Alphaproteobacteria bacterium]